MLVFRICALHTNFKDTIYALRCDRFGDRFGIIYALRSISKCRATEDENDESVKCQKHSKSIRFKYRIGSFWSRDWRDVNANLIDWSCNCWDVWSILIDKCWYVFEQTKLNWWAANVLRDLCVFSVLPSAKLIDTFNI